MKKILVIEDEDSIRTNILELLEMQNFITLEADNGLTGLHLAQELIPDLILCDVMLPKLDGYGVLSALRREPATAIIPFIFLTALADRIHTRKGMELGADDYLIKPFGSEELLRAITIRLEKQNVIVGIYTTVLKQVSQELNKLVHYDKTTNLPNRLLLQERFERVLHNLLPTNQLSNRASRTINFDQYLPLFYLSIDRFNRIVETFGHLRADLLIKAVGHRLRRFTNRGGTVARLGASKLALLLSTVNGKEEVEKVAQAILDSLSQPFTLQGETEVFITASLGISLYPQDGFEIEKLLQLAHQAMSYAKNKGGNTFEFYQKSFNTEVAKQFVLETFLSYALERQELEVYYQPKVSLTTGKIVGAEALLRWQHPEQGSISPSTFIPIAEASNLIIPIGAWVLRTACQQAKAWQIAGFSNLKIAVNLSGRQFNHPHLCTLLFQILAETNLAPQSLELELTESTLIQEPEAATIRLTAFKALGIQIAIDDFGTGYSSLSYLQLFPFDILKIDQRFVRRLTKDFKNQAITKAILEIGCQLNLKIVAEGVETENELKFLCQNNCHEMQGYLFSRPLTANHFAELLLAEKSLAIPKAVK